MEDLQAAPDLSQATDTTDDLSNDPLAQDLDQASDSLLGADNTDVIDHIAPVEENDEIEVDGKKFTLPKSAAEKLRAERMMQADYTRKTQEAAEHRRVTDERAENNQKYLMDVAKIVSIDEQLGAYKGLNWDQIINQDPVEALKHQNNVRQLEQARNEAVQQLTQKQQQHALSEQQSFAKQAQEAESYFAREIPGWSAARSDQLMNYGAAEGLPPKAITQFVIHNPALAKILHKAELYDQIQKKQRPATPAPVLLKPVAKVGQTATARKDPSKMSDTEFAAYRRKFSSRK